MVHSVSSVVIMSTQQLQALICGLILFLLIAGTGGWLHFRWMLQLKAQGKLWTRRHFFVPFLFGSIIFVFLFAFVVALMMSAA